MAKMSKADWNGLRHFSPSEAWGDPAMMERETVFLMDHIRSAMRHPIVIHCGYEKRPYRPTSRHNSGSAVDFHIAGIAFRDAVELAEETIQKLGVSEQVGLGVYPHWNNPGFHLDTRGYRSRWGAVKRNGRQIYVSYDEALTHII